MSKCKSCGNEVCLERSTNIRNCLSYNPIVKVKLDPGAKMPERAHEADAGLDIFSPKDDCLPSKCSVVIDTGVHVAIPEGFVGMLKSKSGLNVKCGIVSEGVIDSGYTGSIKAKLYNHGYNSYAINKGDKITQLVILPILTPKLVKVDELENTDRGDQGFGSSGR